MHLKQILQLLKATGILATGNNNLFSPSHLHPVTGQEVPCQLLHCIQRILSPSVFLWYSFWFLVFWLSVLLTVSVAFLHSCYTSFVTSFYLVITYFLIGYTIIRLKNRIFPDILHLKNTFFGVSIDIYFYIYLV